MRPTLIQALQQQKPQKLQQLYIPIITVMYSSDIKARLFDAQLPIQISCIPVHVKDSQNPSNVSVFHHTHFISIKIDNLIFHNVIFSPQRIIETQSLNLYPAVTEETCKVPYVLLKIQGGPLIPSLISSITINRCLF